MNLLFLLIGSNPLPNYIVAKYLLSLDANEDVPKPDKIICIHTNETKRFSKSLCSVLGNSSQIEKINLGKGGRDPKLIRDEITEKLQDINGESVIHSIHLNYIGGTKTMAVQAEKAISGWIKDNPDVKYILSDVDPVLKKIRLSESGKVLPVIGDLRDKIKLRTEDLLQLHRMKVHHLGSQSLCTNEEDLMNFCRQLWSKYDNSNSRKFANRLGTLSRRLNGLKEKDENKIVEPEKPHYLDISGRLKHNLSILFKKFLESSPEFAQYPQNILGQKRD